MHRRRATSSKTQVDSERRKFIELVENNNDCMVMASLSWQVTYINRAGFELLGRTPDDLPNLEVRDLWDDETLPVLVSEVVPAILSGQHCRFEGKLKGSANIGPVDVDGNAFMISDPNTKSALCLAFSMRDVREQKRNEQALRDSEERMKAILNSAVDGIITINEYGIIENVNPAALKIFGYEDGELPGQNVKILMPDPYRVEHDQYIRNYRHTAERKIIGIGREVVGRRRDGSVFPIDLSVSEVHLGDRRLFTGLIRDITERKMVENHRDLLVAELSHRVKNTLATVDSIAQQTFNLDDPRFVIFHERLQALASTHGRLAEGNWAGAPLRDVIEDEVFPYRTEDFDRFGLDGPEVLLNPKSAISIGMAIHELTTNAVKHGALQVPEGRVDITWRFVNDDQSEIDIEWIESGGPPIEEPKRSGFGRLLLERGLSHDLKGKVALNFDPAGLRCNIIVPLPESTHDLMQNE